MLYKSQKEIVGLGVFTYEVLKDNKYGVKITDNCNRYELLLNVFDTYKEALQFVKLIEKNDVTCITLKDVFIDYQFEKYKKIIDSMR